ncbi:hypothetical protein [Natrarchaeobaculum aegyptiacum]|uniref:Uncharacterized protein n=1 Tax=Natrarchaeobaculum aegyptiacum TaxID=745377 RepID=A0A2Z2I0Q2_9EURY|nr:hypothetical protein [Natrarchaeobaculum aegyptiacum]ARS89788.1 hypothetical protein B1756_08580 [Natrarchaeobaculum aegyptiacum]
MVRERVAASVDQFDWARVLERLLYLFPPVVGVGLVGVLQEADPGVPGLGLAFVLIGTFGYAAVTLGVAVVIGFDAQQVRARSGAEEETDDGSEVATADEWEPNPWLNALTALVWAPAVGVVYLARRHRYRGTQAGWSGWWLVVALSLATTVVGVAVGLVAVVLAIPGLFTAAIGLAGAIAFGAFPVAIHQDAAYVATTNESWRPNPGTYLGLAFVSVFVPPVQPLLAGYYLTRRWRSVT